MPNWTGFWFLSYFCCCCSSSCVKNLFFFGFLANKNLVLLFDFDEESFHVNFMIFRDFSSSLKKNQVILINFRSFVYWKAISIFPIFLWNASGEQNLPNWTGFWFLSYFCCCCSSSCVKNLFFFCFLANKNLVLLFDFGVESFHVNFMIFWVSSTSVKKNQVILINFRSFVYWKAILIFSIFL